MALHLNQHCFSHVRTFSWVEPVSINIMPVKQNNLRKIVIIIISHRDGSFEYPQHMFWLRNKKNNFQLRTLIWGPG